MHRDVMMEKCDEDGVLVIRIQYILINKVNGSLMRQGDAIQGEPVLYPIDMKAFNEACEKAKMSLLDEVNRQELE